MLGAPPLTLRGGTPALLPTSCMSLGKLHNVARPQLLCKGEEKVHTYFRRLSGASELHSPHDLNGPLQEQLHLPGGAKGL